MMKHEAIYALYPSVVTIIDKGSDVVPKDAKGNIVSIDNTAVATKQKELLEEVKKIEETKVAKKASAKAKLKSLGLDDAEISALIGE